MLFFKVQNVRSEDVKTDRGVNMVTPPKVAIGGAKDWKLGY